MKQVLAKNEYSINAMMGVNKVLWEHRGGSLNSALRWSVGEV